LWRLLTTDDVRAEVYCYVAVQLGIPSDSCGLGRAWLWLGKAGAFVVGRSGRVWPSGRGGGGGSVRCEGAVVVDGRAIANRRTDK
jgi:hypothetical protein